MLNKDLEYIVRAWRTLPQSGTHSFICNAPFKNENLTYFIATPPDRGWQRNDGLLLLHSFLSLDILVAFSILRFGTSAKSVRKSATLEHSRSSALKAMPQRTSFKKRVVRMPSDFECDCSLRLFP